jgi:hypothetical protein
MILSGQQNSLFFFLFSSPSPFNNCLFIKSHGPLHCVCTVPYCVHNSVRPIKIVLAAQTFFFCPESCVRQFVDHQRKQRILLHRGLDDHHSQLLWCQTQAPSSSRAGWGDSEGRHKPLLGGQTSRCCRAAVQFLRWLLFDKNSCAIIVVCL